MYLIWCLSAPLLYLVGQVFGCCLIAAVCSTFLRESITALFWEPCIYWSLTHYVMLCVTAAGCSTLLWHCVTLHCPVVYALQCILWVQHFYTSAALHCLSVMYYFDYVLYCHGLLNCSCVAILLPKNYPLDNKVYLIKWLKLLAKNSLHHFVSPFSGLLAPKQIHQIIYKTFKRKKIRLWQCVQLF